MSCCAVVCTEIQQQNVKNLLDVLNSHARQFGVLRPKASSLTRVLKVYRMLSFRLGGKKILGTGGFGTVYLDEFKGEKVAVKRVELVKLNPNESKHEDVIMKDLDHENVVELLHFEDDWDFR